MSDELLEEVRGLIQREKTDHGAHLISSAGICCLVAISIWTATQAQKFAEVLPGLNTFMVSTSAALTQQSTDIRQLQITSANTASKEDLAREISRLQNDIQTAQTRLTVLEQVIRRK